MLISVAFMVDLYYKHIVLYDFLDLFYLRDKSISINFSYITKERFGKFKIHAKIEFFVCKKGKHFRGFWLGIIASKFSQK